MNYSNLMIGFKIIHIYHRAAFVVPYCILFCMTAVKLAENASSPVFNTQHWNSSVSDTSSLQAEDVYEGVSSPRCRSVTRNGLLKLQKFTDVSMITGNIKTKLFLGFDADGTGSFLRHYIKQETLA